MSITAKLRRHGYDVPTAVRALRALVENPDDLPQVFTVIDALSGSTLEWVAQRIRRSPGGESRLERADELVGVLRDRDALRALPEGTLGRAYLAFLESEGISAEGILDASLRGRLPTERTAQGQRAQTLLRDSHDLWHAVTGYHGDIVGEIALLAFTAAQTRNPAISAIVLVALAKGLARGQLGVVLDGYRRGRAAAWLPGVDWEALLARPLEEVRAELKVGAPRVYGVVRSADLREAGTLPKAA
ncbi:MAG TPA: Coq4 family protein [Labilithrix sp.]|jgi:ubiquinone biosynthesis protein COQ4|nr:Coq4 family protein [Labilithrix sp.]